MEIKNTEQLREMLLESIQAVRDGKMDSPQAHAISSLSSRVLQSAKIDLDVIRMRKQMGINEETMQPHSLTSGQRVI